MIIKSKIEIIEETAKYYNLYNRGVTEYSNTCVYYNENNGNMCAVGRCLINPKKLIDIDDTAIDLFEKRITFKSLKPEYRINNVFFWKDLQIFHDKTEFWTKKGLSAKGKNHFKYLKKKYE